MSDWGKIGGAIVGFLVGGPVGAVVGATAGNALIDQPQEQKKQAGAVIQTQEQIAAEQLAAQKETAAERLELERKIAVEQYQLSKTQMKFQMGQQQVELLANLFLDQDRTERRTEPQTGTRILTLPSTGPSGIIDQINLWFDRALRA